MAPIHCSNVKGVMLCLFTFWILVSVSCACLGLKLSTTLQISKSTPKGDISCFLSLSKDYNERLFWTTNLFSCVCDITKINPAYWNSTGWLMGRTHNKHKNILPWHISVNSKCSDFQAVVDIPSKTWFSPQKINNNNITTLIWLAISVRAKLLRDPLVQYSQGLNWFGNIDELAVSARHSVANFFQWKVAKANLKSR